MQSSSCQILTHLCLSVHCPRDFPAFRNPDLHLKQFIIVGRLARLPWKLVTKSAFGNSPDPEVNKRHRSVASRGWRPLVQEGSSFKERISASIIN